MKRIFLAATLALTLMGPARADIYRGLAAYEAADFERALTELKPAAKKGDARAQHLLATMYLRGAGVARNHSQAFQWLSKAAKKGNARAQTALGALFENGHGVPQEFRDAAKWYRKAAEQGEPGAQAALGRLYINGLGLRRDYIKGYAWLAVAEKRLHEPELAPVQTDIKLAVSEMTLRDLGRGETLVKEIAARTRPDAGQEDPKQLAAAALTPNYAIFNQRAKVAYEGSLLPAQKGEAAAQYLQGQIFEFGAGRLGDTLAALMWYGRAAKQGHAEAAFAVARLCLHGPSNCDPKRRLNALRRAAELGHPWAQALYGEARLLGRLGLEKDLLEGYLWLSRAMAQDPRFAKRRAKLASKHMKAVEVVTAKALLLAQMDENALQSAQGAEALAKKKYKTAVKHFGAAAEAGHAPSQYALSQLYAKGRAGKKAKKKAAAWVRKSAEAGYQMAQYELGNWLIKARSKAKEKEKAAAKKKRLQELAARHAEGRQWILRAAESGLRSAQAHLGDLLAQGFAGDKDRVLAYTWYAIEGRGVLGRSKKVKALAGKMEPRQIALAEKLAGDWLPLLPGSPLEARVKDAAAEASRIPQQYQAMAQRGELAFRASLPLAEEGNAQAQFTLAQIHQRGAGQKQDLKRALHWYRQAAGQSHVDATYAAISLCLSEKKVRCPAKDRAAWIKGAAEKGHGEAQLLLGRHLMLGDVPGLKRNVVEAYVWLTKAAATLSGHAEQRLEMAEKHMSPAQIEAAEKLLAERLGGDESAAAAGAFAHLAGDYAAALEHFSQAAEAGHPEAQYMLGGMLLDAQGGPRDVAKARAWLQKAAEGDHAQAQLTLGNLLHRGQGVARDPVAARSWFREAAEADLGSAQTNLANMLARGRGGPQDPVLAYMWYAIAAGDKLSETADERKKNLAKTMTPKQIMVAETLARGWIPVRLHWR